MERMLHRGGIGMMCLRLGRAHHWRMINRHSICAGRGYSARRLGACLSNPEGSITKRARHQDRIPQTSQDPTKFHPVKVRCGSTYDPDRSRPCFMAIDTDPLASAGPRCILGLGTHTRIDKPRHRKIRQTTHDALLRVQHPKGWAGKSCLWRHFQFLNLPDLLGCGLSENNTFR